MNGKAWVALALTAATLAGCIAPTPDDVKETAATVTRAPSKGDWWVLAAQTGPEAPLSAFTISVPEGAVLEEEEHGSSWTFLALEVAPLEPPAQVDRWALLAFASDEGALALHGGAMSLPWTATQDGLAADETHEKAAQASPTYAFVGADDLKPGDDLHLLVAVASPETADFPVAIRFLKEAPAKDDEPADDAAEFLRQRGASAPVTLQPHEQGTGFDAAYFMQMGGFASPFGSGITIQSGEVRKEGGDALDSRPAAAARDVRYVIESGLPEGWTESFAAATSGLGVGEREILVEARGEKASAGGPDASLFGFSVAQATGGFPFVAAIGDGAGPALASLALRDVSSEAGPGGFIGLHQIALGATLDHLFGSPARTHAFSDRGVIRAQGDALVLRAGGAAWTLPGAAGAR